MISARRRRAVAERSSPRCRRHQQARRRVRAGLAGPYSRRWFNAVVIFRWPSTTLEAPDACCCRQADFGLWIDLVVHNRCLISGGC